MAQLYIYTMAQTSYSRTTAQQGGAVYAQQGCLDTAPACVFQPAVSQWIPIEKFKYMMKLTFVNNSAALAGDAMYGGSIDFCYTLMPFSYNGSKGFFNYIHIYSSIFDTTEQTGVSTMSSDPRGV